MVTAALVDELGGPTGGHDGPGNPVVEMVGSIEKNSGLGSSGCL